MFDVIWTDPDRELVGEHRAKKEKNRENQTQERNKKRSSVSTKHSSFSSTAESPFSFLRSHGLKRINTAEANAKARSTPTSSRIASPTVISPRNPLSASTCDARSRPGSGLTAACSSGDPGKLSIDRATTSSDDQPRGLSRHDSIFSKYAGSDIGTATSAPDTSISEEDRSLTHMSRTSRGKSFSSSNGPRENLLLRQLSQNAGQPSYESATWPRTPSRKQLPSIQSFNKNEPPVLVPGPLYPLRPNKHTKLYNPEARRSADQWTGAFESKTPDKEGKETVFGTSTLADMLPHTNSFESTWTLSDVETWKQEIQRMSAMSLPGVFSRLQEICRVGAKTEEEYRPCNEDEATRWILWTLLHLDTTFRSNDSTWPATNIWKRDADRILVLHESQDITSYLAASYSTSKIDHLSTSPLPSTFSANVTALQVASARPTDIPTPTIPYDTIISLSLPSIAPALDIPETLKMLNSTLCLAGTLSLLLIDPLPRAGTVGRHLRTWLRDNLLTNLERSFRCANPSRLVPDWLADASLRGDGSTLTTTRFFANPASVKASTEANFPNATEADTDLRAAHEERVIKAEIRSLAGRLLWKHIWGSFVTGGKFWWDDPLCVRECLELGTVWEYHLIQAVKGGATEEQ